MLEHLENEEINIPKDIVERIEKNLRNTKIGQIDDFAMLRKFAAFDETGTLLPFCLYKANSFSYRANIGFSLLSYCLAIFIKPRGKIKLIPKSGRLKLYLNITKHLVLPREDSNNPGDWSSISWKKGRMRSRVVVNVQLSYS